jgi:quercetin dioxygenase-like cupin family protein
VPRRAHDLYFGPLQLIEFTRFYADEVAAGRYPFVDFDPDERWHQRIYRDGRLDVWLISWLPTQGTQLHDHGGSSGAFSVLSGELTETVVSSRRAGVRTASDHLRATGESVGFGAHYVHDVRNTSDGPAVSVHAYSPPLARMSYYDLDAGALTPLATVSTDDPEAEFVPPVRAAS